jgi:hypothetical protein
MRGMIHMFQKLFWVGTFERAVKTFGQAALAYLGANAVGLLHADWLGVLDVAGLAAALSVLTSLVTATTVVATSPLSVSYTPPTVPPVVPPQR